MATVIITKDNCEKVLQNYLKSKNYKMESCEIDSLADSVSGMMAEYYKLNIKYKINDIIESKTFFCKKLVMYHKIQEIMGKEQGAYEKEDYVYNYLIKECRKLSQFQITYAPECYLSLQNDLFVLDDLTEAGYTIKTTHHDLDHCKAALKTIADFHTTSIILEESTGISLFNMNKEIFNDSLYRKDEKYLGRFWFKNCINTLLKLADYCDVPNIDKLKEKIRNYSEKVYEILQPSKTFVNVICHGDLSQLNILFNYNEKNQPKDCKIVDFQALRYTPPAHDVMNYIYLNTEPKFRKKHLNELLEHYHRIFHLELERYSINKDKHVVLERFHESCDYVLPQVILQTACYSTMIPMNTHFSYLKKDQDLYKKYVYEDRSFECIEVFKMGGLFTDIIIDMFQELYNL